MAKRCLGCGYHSSLSAPSKFFQGLTVAREHVLFPGISVPAIWFWQLTVSFRFVQQRNVVRNEDPTSKKREKFTMHSKRPDSFGTPSRHLRKCRFGMGRVRDFWLSLSLDQCFSESVLPIAIGIVGEAVHVC